MRLKQHREDVADLRLMADAHVQDIAARYLHLIRMAEANWNMTDSYFTEKEKRVLKDAEK